MDPNPPIDVYKEVLTAIVQRFIILIGDPAVRRARRVYSLQLDDDGKVKGYQGDPMVIVQGLVIEYMTLLGPQALRLSQRATAGTKAHHPEMKLPSLLA